VTGSDVTTWTDKSGVGNHFTDGGVATRRPLLVSSAAAFGGQPVVRFGGVDDFLTRAFSWGAAVNVYSVTLIFERLDSAVNDGLWRFGSSGQFPYGRVTTTDVAQHAINGVASVTGTTNIASPRCTTFWWDGSNLRVYNGSTQDANTPATATLPADGTAFDLGQALGTFANMDVAEVIICRAALTTDELASLAAYSTARYGT